MKTRRIDLLYRLKWPWWYLRGNRPSTRPFKWVPKDDKPSEKAQSADDIELVFLGDLLGMGSQKLEVSPELQSWMGEPNYLVFNLEAQIQTANHMPLLKQSFRDFSFFETLRKSFPKTKLVAGVANNHFHDFDSHSRKICFDGLRERGILVKGEEGEETLHLASNLTIKFHTAWVEDTNQKPGPSQIENLKLEKNTQSLLFLHAGQEFAVTPPKELEVFEATLPENLLALVGHHTHRPSGIEWRKERLVAWGLGNFCTPFGGNPVRWGQVLKVRLSRGESGWKISYVDWSFVKCRRVSGKSIVELQESYPYL